ncbi:cytochrome d ubiquinol oxidase subunit II [Helcobacillus sp. ACRRO]|uniref:cytochrome d ubiquinol oxidase subunit II n=1 Tax=Helcobacillus TaxID=1161125 RepID=UPI001EF54CA0|nr:MULTISPECIES: cytochrome d ubiquinol oxidase subunit II [Helcobacillus]MCG7427961.1 cytochrome d ubiquinol oxidase subunit II [Helcobacillus sp. ACRRO]MDK7742145.1 cytochrome d ubiquinol oxidase subunit II [Helcobacillus massiliensis]WOO93700.1 cytochrome d ubiquinol oxidase subunit II [Helcobacillus massiliensis]
MDATFLQILWFALIAVLFLGYFVLEGFDFGVGMNVFPLGKGDERRKKQILRTIGPVWDGNEVWLLVGGGAMFAAFPEWYATLFSGAYLALFVILLALIVRVCAFKYRDKVDSPTWKKAWDWMHFIGGFGPALLWGVAFANIVRGFEMEANAGGNSVITTTLLGLLNPFGILGGLTFVLLFWLHGTLYLALRTTGDLREDANRLAGRIAIPTIVVAAVFVVWAQIAHSHTWWTWIPLVIAALALIAVVPLNRARREGAAFGATSLAIAMATIQLFGGLFPYVLPAVNDDALSLTVTNASSTEYTLTVMTIATVVLLPIVLAYQAWSYWVFRHRVTGEDTPAPGSGIVGRVRDEYRAAFDTDDHRTETAR